MLFELKTLGGIDLRGPDRKSLQALMAQPKRLALLAYLALEGASAPCRRDSLIALFWPDSDSQRGRGSLRQAIHFVRQALDQRVLRSIGDDAIQLSEDFLRCDAPMFRGACLEKRFADALELYRGDFLSGLFVPDASTEFDDWLGARRGMLRLDAVAATSALVESCRRERQVSTALGWTRRAIALAPDDEALQRSLFELLVESGDRAGAIHAYEAFATTLMRELGVAPSAATQALIADIRTAGKDVRASTRAGGDSRKGIAVLTFINMTGNPEQDFLCHGLTEELRMVLSQAEGLRVVQVTGQYGLKGREPDLTKLRRRLNVECVLDGSVWQAGTTVRISAHMIDVRNAHQIWAESHEREWQHVAALRGQIVRAFVAGIQFALTGRPAVMVERPTANIEAYNLYLKGRYYWNQRPRVSDLTLKYLDEAVNLDPGFALAYAAIADAYNTLGAWEGSVMPPIEAFPKAHAAAVKALELDPRLAEAHTALGYGSMHYLWDWLASEAQLRHALALKAHYGHAHHWLSHLLMARGRVRESLEASLQALECDPLDVVINIHLAWHYWFARDYERALEQCERTAELDPKEQWAPMFSGFAYIERGETAAAIDAHRTALERSNGSPVIIGALGYSYAASGERRLAKGVLRRLHDLGAHRGMYAYEMAIIRGALGDTDLAFDQLDHAKRERSTWMAYLGVDPRLDRLRGDPRFAALLEATGLIPVQRERAVDRG